MTRISPEQTRPTRESAQTGAQSVLLWRKYGRQHLLTREHSAGLPYSPHSEVEFLAKPELHSRLLPVCFLSLRRRVWNPSRSKLSICRRRTQCARPRRQVPSPIRPNALHHRAIWHARFLCRTSDPERRGEPKAFATQRGRAPCRAAALLS